MDFFWFKHAANSEDMGKRTHQHIDQRTTDGKDVFFVNRKVGKTTKHLGHAPTLDEAVAILQRA